MTPAYAFRLARNIRQPQLTMEGNGEEGALENCYPRIKDGDDR